MQFLIVAATAAELGPIVSTLGPATPTDARQSTYQYHSHAVDVLVTGVGMVATAAWCARALALRRYDLCLNAGVCGSFTDSLPPGTAVHVVRDRMSELGAQDGERFLTIHELSLLGKDEFPFIDGWLLNREPPVSRTLASLPACGGITVNSVHGAPTAIEEVRRRFAPDVESMEGAAFMYSCLVAGQPFAQVRAVSNVVERRNRAAWKLSEAIEALGVSTLGILGDACR